MLSKVNNSMQPCLSSAYEIGPGYVDCFWARSIKCIQYSKIRCIRSSNEKRPIPKSSNSWICNICCTTVLTADKLSIGIITYSSSITGHWVLSWRNFTHDNKSLGSIPWDARSAGLSFVPTWAHSHLSNNACILIYLLVKKILNCFLLMHEPVWQLLGLSKLWSYRW